MCTVHHADLGCVTFVSHHWLLKFCFECLCVAHEAEQLQSTAHRQHCFAYCSAQLIANIIFHTFRCWLGTCFKGAGLSLTTSLNIAATLPCRYGCVYQREDTKGRVGVHLSKELMAIAGHALKANITTLGPLVLPISEQLIFFGNLVARKVSSVGCNCGIVNVACCMSARFCCSCTGVTGH